MQMSAGQVFYHRLSAARAAQDLTGMGSLYHPDAVFVSLGTGEVFGGRGAILESFKRTFEIAGAISSRSVESLVEAGEAVCVEATLATRFAQMQSYDVYLLEAGLVKRQVGGLISPRPPDGHGPGFPQTQEGAFYHRLCAATQTHDFATLEGAYRPDAIHVNCSANLSWRGREAIMGLRRQGAQNGERVELRSVERFVATDEIISAEVASTTTIDGPMGSMSFDTLGYDVLMLRAGQIERSFSGLISPRWPELQQTVRQQTELLFKVGMQRKTMVMDAFQDSINFYNHRRRWW